ncbi:hypothetical protein NLX86_20305 [Streptomyces sp. A3M-1-3]|uniref:hypothetical protein n=1 Tax=Streptomyces sp. A3M-1-3 TaxID=2962044 RepID=UPI0020B84846|nr:hypothetical protein [Streptomyces sp. A3M-1-3]MCP3820353.1 hypothetical protein [Streptomyces sp. A3M-1-3]
MVNDAAAMLEQVADIGPYFAVTCGERPDSAGFRPLTELYADADVLREYVRAVARRLRTDQPRVAASTLHLGTASRLWSIALASTALTGRVPDLNPDRLWWRPAPTRPVELWLPTPRELPQAPAAALHDTVAIQNLRPLADAVHRACGVSPQILRGNAASALVGALRVLLTRAPQAPQAPHAPHPPLTSAPGTSTSASANTPPPAPHSTASAGAPAPSSTAASAPTVPPSAGDCACSTAATNR